MKNSRVFAITDIIRNKTSGNVSHGVQSEKRKRLEVFSRIPFAENGASYTNQRRPLAYRHFEITGHPH